MGDEEPSLHPPHHGFYRSEAEAPQTSWALLDLHAYIADRENYTSASCKTSDKTEIRVTFCAAPPPLVSYLCVWFPGLKPEDLEKIVLDPTVEAAQSDLLLLEVSVCGRRRSDYFVYKANDGRGPSLQLLEIPEPCLDKRCNIALLARRDRHGGTFHLRPPLERHGGERFRLRRHGEEDSYYYVAVLNFVSSTESEYTYKLWVFDSMEGQWSSRLVSVHCPLYHLTSKVISLGEDGLLGFVDPWRGIIACDMIGQRSPKYLKVPPKLIRNDKVRYRDKKALVLSVDMKKSRLQGVAVFDAERMCGGSFDYTCMQSWIPKYFNADEYMVFN
ncbi:hypothetical protein PR202_gb29702 [Eleusine coracana subsp. coracana]|uniref:DUF1618 domain-containing protein n=1 Tax=Eleusine coracana subsp. coracana TaxID=191504 RepID=A0AAV5G2J5_ELECO|nr:hypothetical protein PR202_gb29702 [Eleusine coracana subsp. coracana]